MAVTGCECQTHVWSSSGCLRTCCWMLSFLWAPEAGVDTVAQWICTHGQGAEIRSFHWQTSPPGISHAGNYSSSWLGLMINALEVEAYCLTVREACICLIHKRKENVQVSEEFDTSTWDGNNDFLRFIIRSCHDILFKHFP